MAHQIPKKIADLIRPDAPAIAARAALGLGDIDNTAIDPGFQARQWGTVADRHRHWAPALRTAISTLTAGSIPRIAGLGNSIIGGSGASTSDGSGVYGGIPTGANNGFLNQVAARLQAFVTATAGSAVGTWNSNYVPLNYAVAGSTVANVLQHLADVADGAPLLPARGRMWTTNPPALVCLMTVKNDAVYPLPVWQDLLRIAVVRIKRAKCDGVLLTDPPAIDQTSGAIVDVASVETYNDAVRQMAADEGCTLIDCARHFRWLAARGKDLRPYFADGIHPSDLGHTEIAGLLYGALLAPGAGHAPAWDRPAGLGRSEALAQYAAAFPGTSYSTGNLTNLTGNPTTSRKVQLNEATATCFLLNGGGSSPGSTINWSPPVGAKGVIVTTFGDPAYTGSYTVTFNGLALSTTGGALNAASHEQSNYYPIPDGNAQELKGDKLALVATGLVGLLGICWVGPQLQEFHDVWPTAVETGTWAADTTAGTNGLSGFGTARACRSSSTVGDTVTITWYGSALWVMLETGLDRGKFTAQTDGGSVFSFDGFNGSTGYLPQLAVKNLTPGWHSTVCTVATKNASATGNLVKLGGYRALGYAPDPSFRDLALAVGETVPLASWWTEAAITRLIVGTPYLDRWTPGQLTLTLTGSAGDKALVRLRR